MRAFMGLVIFALASPAFADSISTPFELDLSSASIARLIAQIPAAATPAGTLHVTLPDQQITSPYKVAIHGIALDLTYGFRAAEVGGNWNEWSLQSQTLSAVLTVASVDASQVVTVQSGGTTLSLTVNATCSNVVLTLPNGTSSASGDLGFALQNGLPKLSLTNFRAAWAPGSWVVQSMNCQGPDGFGDLVAQNALSELQTINPFLNTIEGQIQPQLDALSNSPLQFTFDLSNSIHTPGTSLVLSPTSIGTTAGGLATLGGTAVIEFSSLKNVCGATISGALASASPATLARDSLLVPAELLNEVVRCAYGLGALTTSLTSESMSGFQSLLSDPFITFFVWADLLRFNSSSVFGFDIYAKAAPVLGTFSETSAGALAFNLNAAMEIDMLAPDDIGSQTYVDFAATLVSPATLAITGNQIVLKAPSPKLTLAPTWNASYLATHDVTFHGMDVSLFESQMTTYLKGASFPFTLPVWNAPGGTQVSIEGQKLEGANLRLVLDFKN